MATVMANAAAAKPPARGGQAHMANDPAFSDKKETEKRAKSILNLGSHEEHWALRGDGIDPYSVDKNAEPQSFQEMLASFVTPGPSQHHAAFSLARLGSELAASGQMLCGAELAPPLVAFAL